MSQREDRDLARPLKDFLERVNFPSGIRGTEKRLFTNLSYYASNYALLCVAILTLFALIFDWWLVASVLTGLAGALGVLFAAQSLPLPPRIAAATCAVLGAQLLLSTLASFATAVGVGAAVVAAHAILRPAGGGKGRVTAGGAPDADAHGLPPETLSAFVGSLASDLDDLEARRRRSAASAAADAEEGRGGGGGAGGGFAYRAEPAGGDAGYGGDAGDFARYEPAAAHPAQQHLQQQQQPPFASPGVQQRRGGGAFAQHQQLQQQAGPAAWAPPFGGAPPFRAVGGSGGGGVSPNSLAQQQQRAPGGGAPFLSFQQQPGAAGGFAKRAE